MRSTLLTIALLVAIPGLATACPLCFASSSGGTLYGFYLSTVLLTLMPFALVAVIAFCFFTDASRSKASGQSAAAMRDPGGD